MTYFLFVFFVVIYFVVIRFYAHNNIPYLKGRGWFLGDLESDPKVYGNVFLS